MTAQIFNIARLDFSSYPSIPDNIRGALERYVFQRLQPGGFLTAVLANNLSESVGRADEESRQALFDIVKFIYNELPGNAWGSHSKVKEWING
jgi:hypothetical protein